MQHQQRQRQQQRQAQPQPQPQPHNQFDFNSQPFETIPTSAINNNFNTTKTVNSSSMQGFVPGDFKICQPFMNQSQIVITLPQLI